MHYTYPAVSFKRYENNGSCTLSDPIMDETHTPLYSLSDVQLRFLCPADLDEVRALCQDWFPIEYPLSWYEEITSSTRYLDVTSTFRDDCNNHH